MKTCSLFGLLLCAVLQLNGQTPYRMPPQEVTDILDAPPAPIVLVSPRRDAIALVDYQPHPPIAMLARPFLRLAGVRIDPELHSRQRLTRYRGLFVTRFADGKTVRIALPGDARIGLPGWSNDGKKLAFTRDAADGVELWIADVNTGTARAIPTLRVNDVLTSPFEWMNDSERMLVHAVPGERGPMPEAPKVPNGPVVEETSGKVAKVMTYQDLLKNPYDEKLFEYFGTTQLALVDTKTGSVSPVGMRAMIMEASFSPDEQYLLVTRLKRPFSYRVPYFDFARSVEVWKKSGEVVVTIADLPIADEVPTQGVPTGARDLQWQRLRDATLLWVEALDGGDPLRKVPFRDRVMRATAPFTVAGSEIDKLPQRFSGFDWTANRDEVMISEFDRDRRWKRTSLVNLNDPGTTRKVLFDLSVNDAYSDPGRPIYEMRPSGESLLAQDGEWIFLAAPGASEQGELPALDRLNLRTLQKERLYRSREKTFEQFIAFVGETRKTIITCYETQSEPPNYFIVDLASSRRTQLTTFKDPAPQLTGLRKELVKYYRSDGVPLSGTLYLPPDYTRGTKLPLLIWAYPLEYSDPGTAGQVRGSPYRFTFFRGASPLFFLTQGYAVLMDATMPVVGDPETMNNTFIEQIVGAGKAAIDKLDSMGVIDRNRICVSGHSYGAFMTVNLLAHSDQFAAGIARSGAYNRSLTPFGFQSERRSFWEAPEVYMKVSPFTYANKINKPLLLIHGEVDNNPGTHTIQSERLFQAIRGNGGTARLVLLPFESHGYMARESILHVLAEMFDWANKYVKNRQSH